MRRAKSTIKKWLMRIEGTLFSATSTNHILFVGKISIYTNYQGKGAEEHGGPEEKGGVHPEGRGDEG